MELINDSLIALDIDLSSKLAVIEKIARLLKSSNRLINQQQYVMDVLDREKIITTCLGDGIVIPHAKSESVKVASLVYIRLKNSVSWSGTDQASYIVGIAVPADNVNNQHLMILSSVARKLLDDTIKNKLFKSTSKGEILAALLD